MGLELVPVALGAALVALIAWDVGLTILHPSAKGPLGHRGNRLAWRLVRLAADRTGRRVLSWAGPAAMLTNFVTWLGGIWLGFALIYLPFVDRLSYAPSVPFGATGPPEALYLSAVAMTTVGFGDVVASTDALRFVTVAESASGFAVFTAAITYVLSVYPLVGNIRTSAVQASDLGLLDLSRTARLIAQREITPIAGLHRRVVETHQTVRRFPVLYYFTAEDPAESVAVLFHAAINACLLLCWGVRPEQVPGAQAYCSGLRSALDRVIGDYEAELLEQPAAGRRRHSHDEDLRRLHEVVAAADNNLARGPGDDGGFATFLDRGDRFLDGLAVAYRFERRPLP